MKKFSNIAAALAHNTLSERSMKNIKGGTSTNAPEAASNAPASVQNMLDDEKRRERPGGGINTN